MLIEEILKNMQGQDTSAYDLVDIIVEREDSSALDSRNASRTLVTANEKQIIREYRRKVHAYNIEEENRRQKVYKEREQVQSLIAKMQELQKSNSYDECMYQVYKHFRRWNSKDSLSHCDYVLKYVSTDDFNIHILISLLMASYPLRNRLSYRSVFYEKVLLKARLTYSSHEIEKIFGGLK